MAGEDDPRLRVVMMELFGQEFQREVQPKVAREEIQIQFQYMLTRPNLYRRYIANAKAILNALDTMYKKPDEKLPLTGEELWKSIVEASKP